MDNRLARTRGLLVAGLAVLGTVLCVLSPAAAQDGGEKIFMDTPALALKAFERPGQLCGPQMKYKLRAAVSETYSPPPEKVEKFLGGLRAALSQTCPDAVRIVLGGYVGDDLYFAASASAKDDWRLIWLYAPPP